MAVAHPDTGSFSTYAERSIGPWAGFSIGWLYWWFWVLVIPVEATAAALVLGGWLPDVPQWVFALVVTALLTASNLASVANFGEFEFWFALIKVVAIVAFIGIGLAAILGLLPESETSGISALYDNGGFMPNGFGAVLTAMLITMFTFMGTEIVTIAAAESSNPAKGIRRAVNSVIWRISLFYVGSIFVVVAIVDWQQPSLVREGSYQAAIEVMGLGEATWVLDLVVLTAVASCLNSALYTASRMAFSLARRGEAPARWGTTTSRGVPAWAILASTSVGFLAVAGNYVLPAKIIGYLLASSGAIALLVYLVIAVSQLRMRRRLDGGEARAVDVGVPVADLGSHRLHRVHPGVHGAEGGLPAAAVAVTGQRCGDRGGRGVAAAPARRLAPAAEGSDVQPVIATRTSEPARPCGSPGRPRRSRPPARPAGTGAATRRGTTRRAPP